MARSFIELLEEIQNLTMQKWVSIFHEDIERNVHRDVNLLAVNKTDGLQK